MAFTKKKENEEQVGVIVDCGQCMAKTRRNRRCKYMSCLPFYYCKRHLKSECGLEIKKSQLPNGGNGLYSTIDRELNSFIASYEGPEIPLDVWRKVPYNNYGFEVSSSKRSQAKVVIDGSSTSSSPGRYINMCRLMNRKGKHLSNGKSCTANVKVKKKFNKAQNKWTISLVAKRPIRPGDELFVGYGKNFFLKIDETTIM